MGSLASLRPRRSLPMVLTLFICQLLSLYGAVLGQTATNMTAGPTLLAWVRSRTGGALFLEWTIAASWYANNSVDDIESFRVFFGDQQVATVGAAEREYAHYGLVYDTEYAFQVSADLVAGSNATADLVSDAILARTALLSAPGVSRAPQLKSVTGGTIQVETFTPDDTGGANLTTITIVVRRESDGQTVINQGKLAENTTFSLNHLDAQTTYWVTNFATNEGGAAAYESMPLYVTTRELELPGPCPPPTIVMATGGSVRLQLHPPFDDGGARITSYVVFTAVNGSESYEEVSTVPVGSSIDLVDVYSVDENGTESPLMPDTMYKFKALAVNLAEICTAIPSAVEPAGWTTAWTLQASVPDAPPPPFFIGATGGQISTFFIPPRDMKGSTLMGFSVLLDDLEVEFVAASSSILHRLNFLSANSLYSVRIAAVSDLGSTSLSESTQMSTTVPTAPSAPRFVRIGNVSASSAVVQWSVPVDNGGVSITGYTVNVIASGSSSRLYTTSRSLVISTLLARTVYTVKVAAVNDVGFTSSVAGVSGTSFETPALSTPSSPWNVSPLFSSGGAIEVAWSPPVETGGVPLKDVRYNATMFAIAPCGSDDPASPCSSCNAVDLDGNYVFVSSKDECIAPSGACPDGSSKCCVARMSGVDRVCSRASTSGRYRLTRGANSTTFYGLRHSSIYYFGVQARNSVDPGAYSTLVGLYTGSPSKASYPVAFRQLAATGGSIQLAWDAPMDSGGTLITGYRVYRDLELLSDKLVVPPFTDCGGLSAESTYRYSVAAVNSSLHEGDMAFLVASTTSLTAPLPPTAVDLASRTGDSLNVTVTLACDNGGSAMALVYQYRVLLEGAILVSSNFACCSFVVGRLSPNELYSVQVRSINGAGSPQWIERQFSTTTGIPAEPAVLVQKVNTFSTVLQFATLDPEVLSYDVFARRLGDANWANTLVPCDSIADAGIRSCPSTYRLESLLAHTDYEVYVRANGMAGSSNSNVKSFRTLNETAGSFQFGTRLYATNAGGSVTMSAARVGGTAGASNVSLSLISPSVLVMTCECQPAVGCKCEIRPVASGSLSTQSWQLAFIDGQTLQNISVAVVDDDWNISQPTSATLQLIGSTMTTQAEAILQIWLNQATGVAAFTVSSSDVLENDSYAVVDMVRVNGSVGLLSVQVETFDITGLGGYDYVSIRAPVVFGDRQTNTSVLIKLIDDAVYSGTRSFGVRILNQTNSRSDLLMTRVVTIKDDEDLSRAVPSVPSGFEVVRATGGEIELECVGADDNSTLHLGFLVRVAVFGNSDFVSYYNMTDSTFILSGLPPKTLFRVAVAAWNSFGTSRFSPDASVATKATSIPSPPRMFRAVKVGGTMVKLQWDAPRDNGGSSIMGYDLTVTTSNDHIHSVKTWSVSVLTTVIFGLNVSTEYMVYVAARSIAYPANNILISNATTQVVTTNGTAPSQPPQVKWLNATPSGGSLSFAFSAPEDSGGWPIDGYTLYLREQMLAPSTTAQTTTSEFRVACNVKCDAVKAPDSCVCTIYKLAVKKNYEVYAMAHNAMGASVPGLVLLTHTSELITLPSAPTNFRAGKVTSGNIYLEWDLPLDLGGVNDVVGYIVYQALDAFTDSTYFTVYNGQDSPSRSVVLRGFERNSVYGFAVVALNSASYCVSTDSRAKTEMLTVATLSYSKLTAPQNPYVISKTGGSMTIGWSAPDDLAGVPLYGYTVSRVDKQTNQSTLLSASVIWSSNPSFEDYGLEESTEYCYTVTAVNQDGPSDPSEVFCASTSSATPPSSVRDIRAISVSGGSILLSWDLPLDTGGEGIIYYQIVRTVWGGATPPSRSFVTTVPFRDSNGLSASTWYTYQVIAYNSIWAGQSAYLATPSGDPTIPQAPIIQDIVLFGGKIQVNWIANPDTGGLAISSYSIRLLTADRTGTVEASTTNDTSFTFWGLDANTRYYIVLTATNAVGESTTAEHLAATEAPDLASQPPQPVASDIRGGSITLSVSEPTYNGGENITMELYQGARLVYTFATGERETTIYGLVARTQYTFLAAAKNSMGEAFSPELSVSTGPISKPSQVVNLALVGASYDRLQFEWSPVSDNGGDSGMYYNMTYFRCGSDGTALETALNAVGISGTTIKLSSLVYVSRYCVSVAAVTGTFLVGLSSETVVAWTEEPLGGVMIAQEDEVSVSEDQGYVLVPVARINGSYESISFSYWTISESATGDVNFVSANSTVQLTTNAEIGYANITILNDAVYNPGISFVVFIVDVLTSVESSTRVVITDDGDAGAISFTTSNVGFLENSAVVTLTLTRIRAWSPLVVIEPFFSGNRSQVDRFQLLQTNLTFEEGTTDQGLELLINDETQFQFTADSINVSFRILQGGARYGAYTVINVTAVDDEDVSLPRQCSNLRKISATGGSVTLQWSPPIDRGGVNVALQYSVEIYLEGQIVMRHAADSEIITIYGLNASSVYDVTVQAVNSAGAGEPTILKLVSTTSASLPTAPQSMQLLSASSSSLLFSWAPPLDVGGTAIVGYKIYNVSASGVISPFPFVTCSTPTQCIVKGLVAVTSYTVQVRAISSYSALGALSPATVYQTSNPDLPDAPPSPVVTWVSAGGMTISMQDPLNIGGSDIHQYRLYLMANGDPAFELVYVGSSRVYTIYRLSRETVYSLKFQVVNAVGPSDYSPITFQKTLERSLASAPLNVSVASATGGALQLMWEEPLDIGGRDITGYTVTLVSINSTQVSQVAYDGKGDARRAGALFGLSAGTAYSMYVVAFTDASNCFDQVLQARSPILAAVTTPATVPASPTSLVVVTATGGMLELAWTTSRDTGGVPLTGYTVYVISPTGGQLVVYASNNTNVTSFGHTGLTEATTYTYVVVASNRVGDSLPSLALVATTMYATPPSVPRDVVQLTFRTGGAIQVAWSTPLDSGGQPVVSYWVYRNGVLIAQDIPATMRNYTDAAALSADTAYGYSVRAFSQSGLSSDLSATCTARTSQATAPRPPKLIDSRVGASYINVSWSPNADSGGLSTFRYEVALVLNNVGIRSYAGAAGTYTFNGLQAATMYLVFVRTVNTAGSSDALSVAATTSSPTVPGSPASPIAVSVFGGNFTVQISLPLDAGGAPITAMKLYEQSRGILATLSVVSTAVLSYAFIGATSTTNYVLWCTAVSVVGEGPPSTSVTIRTASANQPGSVGVAPQLVGTTGTSLSLTWTLPLDFGGDMALSYEVRFVAPTGAAMIAASNVTEVTINGLKHATLYTLAVRAVNRAGSGGWSPALNGITQPDAAGQFSFVSTTATVMENATMVSLPVQRTNGLSGKITVTYTALSSSSATVGKDFALQQGSILSRKTIEFQDQQNQSAIVVYILNDAVYESPDETFFVQLATVSGSATLGANTQMVVTIADDGDAGQVSFARPAMNVSEDTQTALVPIIRERGSSGRILIQFVYTDITATIDRDYRRLVSTVVMDDGVAKADLKVAITNDRIFEFPDETFSIRLFVIAGGARAAQSTITVTILDDGDVSVPGLCPPPSLISSTGGLATIRIQLPAHNGSTSGKLLNYVLRLAPAMPVNDLSVPAESVAQVGHLRAQTTYQVSVAANNSVGVGPFSDMMVFTTAPPSLPGPVASANILYATGGSILLSWSSPLDEGGVNITKYRLYMVKGGGVPQLAIERLQPTTSATVNGLTAATTYGFIVQAGNNVQIPELASGWGAMSGQFKFATTAATLPGPSTVHLDYYRKPTGGAITLSWDAPVDTGGLKIDSYKVYAKSTSRGFFLTESELNLPDLYATAKLLNASTSYRFFVLAQNTVNGTRLPGNVSVTAGASVVQTTSDLSKQLQYGAVITVQDAVVVVGNMSKAGPTMIPLLFNHVGSTVPAGPATVIGFTTSFAVLNTTAATLPRPPLSPTLKVATGGAINITIESPFDTGGIPITDFKVYVNGQIADSNAIDKIPVQLSYLQLRMVASVGNLDPNTTYTISTVALNALSQCYFGREATSPEVVFSTGKVSHPSRPEVAAVSTTGGGMTLSVKDPFDLGGQPIQTYQIYYRERALGQGWILGYNGTEHRATMAGLRSRTAYEAMASVNNGLFESDNSSVLQVKTTSVSAPGSCVPVALVTATGGMLNVSWEYPPDNGGSTVSLFYVSIASGVDGSGKRIYPTSALWYAFYGLIANSEYDVVVRAKNAIGIGPESSPVRLKTTSGSPPVGAIDITVEKATGGAAYISFNEPDDLGGARSADMVYQLFVDRDNRANLSFIPAASSGRGRRLTQVSSRKLSAVSTAIVTGLDPESLYDIQVKPINVFASGNLSVVSQTATTAASAPTAPKSLKVVALSGGSVTLQWEVPDDLGGMPLLGYGLSIAENGGDAVAEAFEDNAKTTTVYDLLPETTYICNIVATNAVGNSSRSVNLTFQTSATTAPGEPRDVAIRSVTFDQVECEWAPPLDSGGETVVSYTVRATPLGGGVASAVAVLSIDTYATLRGLQPSTEYGISVIATNSVGVSSTKSVTRYVTIASSANVPSTLQLGCVGYSSATLSWYLYTGATAYRVLRNGTEVFMTNSDTSAVDEGANFAENYYEYVIEAEISGSWGPSSTSIMVSPQTLADAEADTICRGASGVIKLENYGHNLSTSWQVDPQVPFSRLTMNFSRFDVECDHDYLEIIDTSSNRMLWKGGCFREGTFVYQASKAVLIRFVSDDSVAKGGFELHYMADASPVRNRIPAPGSSTNRCSRHGQSDSSGSCTCSVGFTGEDCSNRIVCCTDKNRCYHPVCDIDPERVIVVSAESGDDDNGTGRMMSATEKGTIAKAVRSLAKAISISSNGDYIFVYPGTYKGAANQDLSLEGGDLAINSLKGPYWTKLDCAGASRALSIDSSSSLALSGLTFENCSDTDGGAIRVSHSKIRVTDIVIIDGYASQRGGAIFAEASDVVLLESVASRCASSEIGGAIYALDSRVTLNQSNVTHCLAQNGGAVALMGQSELHGAASAALLHNKATDKGGAAYIWGDVVISGVDLASSTANTGGGIAVQPGSSLLLQNLQVSDNIATENGGGITTGDNTLLYLRNTSINNNEAVTAGGGIYISGQATVAGSDEDGDSTVFEENVAGDGGGVYIEDASVVLEELIVQRGNARLSGGGITSINSTVAWRNVSVMLNNASYGGAISATDSQLDFDGTVYLANNSAVNGGGLWLKSSTLFGTETSICEFNSASDCGGCISASLTVHLEQLQARDNVAGRFGGGICATQTGQASTTLTLQGVNVSNCSTQGEGGGISLDGCNIIAADVIVRSSGANAGGGVYGMNATISGVLTVEGCTAIDGGGLYLRGTSEITGTMVQDCVASRGGAMFATDSSLKMSNLSLLSSRASQEGGGFYVSHSSVDAQHVVVAYHESSHSGGGLYVLEAEVVHQNLSVSDCQAHSGGGAYVVSSSFEPIDFKVPPSVVFNNTALHSGGNVFVQQSHSNSTIAHVDVWGGRAAVAGGGVKIVASTATLRNSIISSNEAAHGGGISVDSDSTATLVSVLITENAASSEGGGMSLVASTLLHDGLKISSNVAPNGGGMFAAGSVGCRRLDPETSIMALVNSNSAIEGSDSTGYGGTLYIASQSAADVSGLDIQEGHADIYGGGIYVDSSYLTLSESRISKSDAVRGGAIYEKDGSTIMISATLFVENYASDRGGAIAAVSADRKPLNQLHMQDTKFESNSAESYGGAIALERTNVDGSHNVLTDSIAHQGSGGAIAVLDTGVINATHWEFYNNTVGEEESVYGGTLYMKEGTKVTISNSMVLSNELATLVRLGGLIYVEGSSSSLSIDSSRLAFGQSYSGGAIYAIDAVVSVKNSSLDNGYAYDFGGAIYGQNIRLDVTDSSVSDNFAYYNGGAIFMKGGGALTVEGSDIERNAVQDSGGAIYLAPGAEIGSTIVGSGFVSNTNYGFGSALYIGRKNKLALTKCTLTSNGGKNTDGGTIYLVDAEGTVQDTLFERNHANTGAAIDLSRDAKLKVVGSTMRNNTAVAAGGALHASVRAAASVSDTTIEDNSASEGGAVYATGSATFVLTRTHATSNRASSFGGAFCVRGSANIKLDQSECANNRAYTGGGLSMLENASIVIKATQFTGNTATDFGGAIYVDKEIAIATKNSASCSTLRFSDNKASAGDDIFWVYHSWFALQCIDCSSLSTEKVAIATSAKSVTPGWWPSAVTSGVKLGVAKDMDTNNGAASNRRLLSANQSDLSDTEELSDPSSDTLWPTIVVRDYYGVIASQDNQTQCIAHISSEEDESFSFIPSGWVSVKNGYITFADAEVQSISRTKPYQLNVECSLSSDVDSAISVNITVESCLQGYENVDGQCLSCEKGTYSLDGLKCYLCPLGATCEELDANGVSVGVSIPSRLDGYYLTESRESLLASRCSDPNSWAADDPCRDIVADSLSERIYKCSSNKEFEVYWSRRRVFACISGMEYYGCDTFGACVQDKVTVVQMSAVTLASFNTDDQCDVGYSGVMCATCDDNFYKVANGSCRPCKDPNDPSVARMTQLLTMVPIVYAVVAFAILCYFFSDASEKEIMKYARAAKRFQIYSGGSRAASILLAVRLRVQERAAAAIRMLRAKLPSRRRRAWLFQIAPVPLIQPGFRAEKLKILLGFFQIFGGFKRNYEIPWPDEMSRLMDVYSITDFNFIDITSVECYYKRDYFTSYRLSLFAVLILLLVTGMLLAWGSVRYRVILSTLPRHCVRCGLPVFQMLRRSPQTLVKRATTVSMLKIVQKEQQNERKKSATLGARMKANLSSRAEDAFVRARSWMAKTSAGQAVNRVMIEARLPASSSTHTPTCPTSHRISNDVQAMVVRSNIRMWRARVRLRLNYQTYQNRCVKLLFWILLLFYPDLCARVIGIFYCEEIGPYFYMTRDRRFRCYEGDWVAYLPLSILLLLLWVAGVPLLFWSILFIKRRHGVADTLLLLEDPSNVEHKERLLIELRRDLVDRGKKIDEDRLQLFQSEMMAEFLRDRKLQEPSMIAQVGFIYHAYDARFWWFEVWDLGRKLFLNCVVSLLATSGANRCIAGLIVLLVYLSVMLFFQPYKEQSDSALAGVTQIQLFITLFCGLILKMGSHFLEDSVVSLLVYAAFITNVLTMVFAVASIAHERYVALRHVRRQVRENHRRAIQAHVRKLWRRAYGYAFTEVYLRDLSIRPMPVHVILELARRDRAARVLAELGAQLENTVPLSQEADVSSDSIVLPSEADTVEQEQRQ